jgi:RNA polymerase sigma-70 factor (family 1)
MFSDNDIFKQIQQGNKAAFETFFKTHYSNLCAYANKYVQDIDAAEEIVQELFFQIWQRKEELTITSSLKSYLFRSVHNSCLNYIKQKSIHRKHEQTILTENRDDIYHEDHDHPEEDDMGSTVRAAIEKLPPERRKVFIMSRYEELSYKDIAEKLNLSVKTVENQIGKALKFLREKLKDYIPILIIVISELFQKIFNN